MIINDSSKELVPLVLGDAHWDAHARTCDHIFLLNRNVDRWWWKVLRASPMLHTSSGTHQRWAVSLQSSVCSLHMCATDNMLSRDSIKCKESTGSVREAWWEITTFTGRLALDSIDSCLGSTGASWRDTVSFHMSSGGVVFGSSRIPASYVCTEIPFSAAYASSACLPGKQV
jgi:hypothetical protein